MKKLIKTGIGWYVRAADWLSEKVGQATAWLTTCLVISVCVDVVARYAFNKSFVALPELHWHLFSLIFLLGAAYTLKENKHVRVDIFYARLSEKGKAMIDLLGSLVFLLPFTGLAIWASSSFAQNAFKFKEGSPNPGGLPTWYLLKMVIPVAFVLLFIQGLSMAGRAILTLMNDAQDERHPETLVTSEGEG